jgi:hypothetical protein
VDLSRERDEEGTRRRKSSSAISIDCNVRVCATLPRSRAHTLPLPYPALVSVWFLPYSRAEDRLVPSTFLHFMQVNTMRLTAPANADIYIYIYIYRHWSTSIGNPGSLINPPPSLYYIVIKITS